MTDYRRKYKNQFAGVAYLLMAISLALSLSCTTMSEKRYVEVPVEVSSGFKASIIINLLFLYASNIENSLNPAVDPSTSTTP